METTIRKQAIIRSGIIPEFIAALFPGQKKTGNGQLLVCCPFHDDRNPSFSINTENGIFNCFGCGRSGNFFDLYMQIKGVDFMTALLQLEDTANVKPTSRVVATFIYHDQSGLKRYWKKRFEPGFGKGGKKSFCFYHQENGREKKGRGCDPLAYNLHGLAVAARDEPVFFLEGEAKADLLLSCGLVATSLDSGGNSRWPDGLSDILSGRDVYILPDNDRTGEKYLSMIVKKLFGVAGSVSVLRLPDLPDKGDIIDWVKAQGKDKVNSAPDIKRQFLGLLPTATALTQQDTGKKRKGKKRSDKGVNALLPILADDALYISVDDGTGYIHRNGRLFRLDSRNRRLSEDIRLDAWEQTGSAPSKETVATVIALLSARSRREGKPVELYNRTGRLDGNIYYNLGENQAVKIGPDGWSVVAAPVMFREFSHQRVQVKPRPGNDDPSGLLDFFLLKEEQQLLFLVTVITCFLPEIAHPAIHVSGSQGSGKSFATKLIKSLLDPSSVLLSVMPRKPEDLDLLIYRHKALVLDNLSALNTDTCDRLCSLISGGIIEKRTLHTDLETTILKSNPVILYSSIGGLHSRPDLTERTIVFDLQRIPEEKRMEESAMLTRFARALPSLLAGIFSTIARAMKIYPSCGLESLPRMAEFARWGYAVAEALGGHGEQFLEAYRDNSTIQTGELIERDTFFAAIAEAMAERRELSGSFNEVLQVLKEYGAPGEAETGYPSLKNDRTFPTARGFRGHIERIRIPLENMGITFRIDNRRTGRGKAFVTLVKPE